MYFLSRHNWCRSEGAVAASATAWRQTVNLQGGCQDTSFRNCSSGPNRCQALSRLKKLLPETLSPPQEEIWRKKTYRTQGSAHSILLSTSSLFSLLILWTTESKQEENLKEPSPFPPFTSLYTQTFTKTTTQSLHLPVQALALCGKPTGEHWRGATTPTSNSFKNKKSSREPP